MVEPPNNFALMEWLSGIAEHPFYEFAIILFLAALLGGWVSY